MLRRNLVANVLQADACFQPALVKIPAGGADLQQKCYALPLYHIFAFTVGMMLSLRLGGKLILIANPRDFAGVLAELAAFEFTCSRR